MAVAPGPVPGAHWHQRVAISCHDGVLSAANALLTGKASKTARALGPGNKSRDDSLGVARVDRSCTQCRSEEHTSELQSLMRISYAVFCLKKTKQQHDITEAQHIHNTKRQN